MSEDTIGRVDRYFRKVGVAALELQGPLSVGDRIRIVGATTDLEIVVESMQIDLEPVEEAGTGDDVGIKVPERVRPNDRVIRLSAESGGIDLRIVLGIAVALVAAYLLLGL